MKAKRIATLSSGFHAPFSRDFSTLADGYLPYPWLGPTFRVYSGTVVNDPGLGSELLTDADLEAAYTAGLCDTLTATGSPAVAQSADAHRGTKAQEFTATAFNDRLNYPIVAGEAGAWYQFSQWVKRTAGAADRVALRVYQAASLPTNTQNALVTQNAYTKVALTFISTAANNMFIYPAVQTVGAPYDTVIVDDGSLLRLTYSTLFAMLPTVPRSATVKIKPSSQTDGSWSGILTWANATSSPSTYVIAGYCFQYFSGYIRVFLLKCVAGTYTTLINVNDQLFVADAWLEIRPVDNDTVGMYYNDVQIGADIDVSDVPGSHPGLLITGGNTVKGFFVG